MQITLSSTNQTGPTYIVTSGNTYSVDAQYNITDDDGEPAIPSWDNFNSTGGETEYADYDSEGSMDDHYQDSYSDEGEDEVDVKKPITFVNQSEMSIRVKVQNDGSGGSNSMWPIAAGDFDQWGRLSGLHLAEIWTLDGNCSKYYTEKAKTYVWAEGILTNKKTGEEAERGFNLDNGSDIPEEEVCLFNSIKFSNNLSCCVYIRLKAGDTGSQDLFPIQEGESRAWKRYSGTYLVEINTEEETTNYYVEANHSYTAFDGSLVDDSTGDEVEICFDTFQENSLKPSKKQEDIIQQQDEQPQEIESTETAPWWNNIKPNYVKGQKFTDAYFPPTTGSIQALDEYGNDREANFRHSPKDLIQCDDLEFQRIPEIFGSDFQLFKDSVECRDIGQGSIGDCWFMSSVAALSTRPDLIQKLFKTKSANSEGYYEIFFYHDGEKHTMFLDDHIVCRYGKPYFAKPNGSEVWVILLEKLLAKYEGGYNNINGGLCDDALSFLTGGLCQRYTNLQSKWTEICSAIKRGNIVTCGSPCRPGCTDKDDKDGIYYGHAYSLLDALQYSGQDGSFKLVKVRNPWGSGEWKGKWCDDDYRWTDEYRKFFNFKEGSNDDGIFYMDFTDFVEYYEEVYICNV